MFFRPADEAEKAAYYTAQRARCGSASSGELTAANVVTPLAERWILLGPLAVAAGALLGLFVVTQALATWAQLMLLPDWSRWLALASIGLLVGVVAAGAISFYLKLRRLQVVRQLALRDLNGRWSVQALARADAHVAAIEVDRFVKKYRQECLTAGSESGLSEPLRSRLVNAIQRLESAGGDSDKLKCFEQEFQRVLDEAGDERLRQHALTCAVRVALSPNPLSDALIAVHYSLRMIADLCLIYNVRTTRAGHARLLAEMFFAAYITGKADQWEDMAEDALRNQIGDGMWQVLASKASTKIAAGLVNYRVLLRVGRQTQARLRLVVRG